MKLGISTIAWSPEDDEGLAPIIGDLGITGVELAPTRIWADLEAVSARDATRHRQWWQGHGIEIFAMQALLFGRPDLVLFGPPAVRERMLAYLARVIGLGGALGAGVLVFGSPRQRQRGPLSMADAEAIAVPFFRRLGEFALREGTRIAVEANPPAYHADYLINHAEVAAFVRQVDHPGVVHHVDLGAVVLAGENLQTVVDEAQPLAHFHASAPHLAALATVEQCLGDALTALGRSKYAGWVSIEMRRQAQNPSAAVAGAVHLAKRLLAQSQ